MSDLFKIMRLAVCLFALPLAITAVVSAEALFSNSDGLINESEFLGTNPAAIDADYGHINHRLMIDENGGVSGQIMQRDGGGFQGAADMTVTLNQKGRAVAQTQTKNDGVFHFENVSPGAYTFIATSADHITTFGVYLEDSESPPSETIQFSVAASGANPVGVREILNSDTQAVAYRYLPSSNEINTFRQVSRVKLDNENAFSGRVLPLLWEDQAETFDLTGNQVYLLDNSGVVANSPVGADGSFSLPDVAPGVYDFVSFGPHGAAAFSMEVLPSDNSGIQKNASFGLNQAEQETDFNVVLSEPVSGETEEVTIEIELGQQAPMGGGGYGGGGGGGAGFGDWGGIIGLALGAWVLSEAFNSSNNNSQVIQPPIVVPPAQSPF